jgi:hypothetical protein
MQTRNKFRLKQIFDARAGRRSSCGYMRGSGKILGDIVSPAWDGGPWDCELGIAYRDENGIALDYNGNEIDMIEAVKNAR